MARRRKRATKTGVYKDSKGRWRDSKTGKFSKSPQAITAENKRNKKGNLVKAESPVEFSRSTLTGKKDVGKSGGASKRKKERQAAKSTPKPKKASKKAVRTPSKPSDGAFANDVAEYLMLEYAIDVAKFGWRTMRSLAPVESGALRDSIDFTVEKNKLIKGYTADIFVGEEIYYADWVTEGTGIYGPEGTPITPVSAKYLRFEWKKKGNILIFAKSVKGQTANPFADVAYRATLAYSRQKDKELADKLGLMVTSNIS